MHVTVELTTLLFIKRTSNTLKQGLQEYLKEKEENLEALLYTYTTIMTEIQAENMVASLDSILIMAGEQDKPISLCDLLDGMEITKKIIEDVKSEINNMTE